MCSLISLIDLSIERADRHRLCKPKLGSVRRCHIDTNAQPGAWLVGRTSSNRSCGHQAHSKDVSAFDFSHGRRFGRRILDHKVVKPVGDPGSVYLLAFGSVVNIPTILVLPIN